MAKIQNFEIPAGNSMTINFDVGPDDTGFTLLDKTCIFSVFATNSVGLPAGERLIKKMTDYGLEVDDSDTLKFHVDLVGLDTIDLLGNYYHETQIFDRESPPNLVKTTTGVMTVTDTPTTDYSVGEVP